ncbi:MAG: hypothetical protein OXC01_02630 [Immundisolibacterales bacterium]|nr:hypothetical protein [Immundisolibacterales bacterium]
MGGRILAVLCWSAFLLAGLVFVAAAIVRFEGFTEEKRRYALANEQRAAAGAIANLAHDLATGAMPTPPDLSALRTASLEILARIPPGPSSDELLGEWAHIGAGLDTIRTEWRRILATRAGIEDLRAGARSLENATATLTAALSDQISGPRGRASGEVLAAASRLFAQAVDRASLADIGSLDRAAELLDMLLQARRSLAADIVHRTALPVLPALNAELAAVDARLSVVRSRAEKARGMANALVPVSSELKQLAEAGARVSALLPTFEATGRRPPDILGAPLDDWLFRSALIAGAGLIGVVWRRRRLLKAELIALDHSWAEAAESDWKARILLRDLVRTIGTIGDGGRRPPGAAAMGNGDLEDSVRVATAALPRIVARRARLAAALLSAGEPLRRSLSAAREAAQRMLDTDSGKVDPGPFAELETSFRGATLFAMATLVRELRAAASEVAASEQTTGDAESPPETVRDVVGRGFELIEWCLERALAGEEEEWTALFFLIDDLRTVRGRGSFSADLDFNPDLGLRDGTVSTPGAGLGPDAARVLPSFRKGLKEWTGGGTDGSAGAKLVRGSVGVLARAVEEKTGATRGFWGAAAAFCTALCESSIPSGPAVRRIVGEVADEFARVAEGKGGEGPPPEGLLRELLAYVAIAKSDHEEIENVRSAFDLDRHPIAIPDRPYGTEPGTPAPEGDLSQEIIQQLEGIRAALDRIDAPTEDPSGPMPQG